MYTLTLTHPGLGTRDYGTLQLKSPRVRTTGDSRARERPLNMAG